MGANPFRLKKAQLLYVFRVKSSHISRGCFTCSRNFPGCEARTGIQSKEAWNLFHRCDADIIHYAHRLMWFAQNILNTTRARVRQEALQTKSIHLFQAQHPTTVSVELKGIHN